jgi:poly-gamma-glutamate capsule biosynthesis protein CapA/YwtB (metallophosphatase superfamily)
MRGKELVRRLGRVARLGLLAGAACVVTACSGAESAAPDAMRMILVGQALTDYDIRQYRPDSFEEMKEALRGADVTFTNLEVPIQTSAAVKPVKTGIAAHGAPPAVLDALEGLGFNLLSLSNNHSSDFGEQGLIDTIAESRKRGFAHAGTGRTLDEATAPAFVETRAGRVALVAMASGALTPESAARPNKPGVNELKLDENGRWDEMDQARILASIGAARAAAPHVIAYQHHHYWKDDLAETPPWLKEWARKCIDAGATLFVAHGVPILHGIEIYKGRPIFFSLGNFIFHSRQIGRWPALAWRSVIADLRFEGDVLRGLTLTPILLNEQGTPGDLFNQTRGAPRLARGVEAAAILERLAALSRELGTDLTIRDGKAELRLGKDGS